MTLLQLNYVMTAAKYGSITSAAKQLRITPSNLSSSIKAVENEYKIKIFKRTQYGVEITEAGSQFIACARLIMNLHQEMTEIGGRESRANFSVVAMMTTFFNDAFTELCVHYQKKGAVSFLSCPSDAVSGDPGAGGGAMRCGRYYIKSVQ